MNLNYIHVPTCKVILERHARMQPEINVVEFHA